MLNDKLCKSLIHAFNSKESLDSDIDEFLSMTDDDRRLQNYQQYGVDNDFDLIEAMYADYSQYLDDLISDSAFVELRIECAMNPEYTDRCLVSPAFVDIRDKILAVI